MKKHYETELPEGYREALVIDAATPRLGLILNLIAAAIMAVIGVTAYFIICPDNLFGDYSFLRWIIFCASILAYIVLHELVHGAAYKLLTKQKLTYGFTASVAYCGVPHIFVYRKTALIALLSPFVVFTVVFTLLVFLLPGSADKFLASILLAIHVGGCIGDLWCTFIYIFKLRSPKTLLRDTGPKQTFFTVES